MNAEHPGKKIEALLKANSMTRKELAARTAVTEKHISTLISGERNITASFARKLGCVFDGYNASRWQQLQNEYDLSELEKKERNSITDEEFAVLKHLGDVISYFEREGGISKADSRADKVLRLRELLKISDLTMMPHVSYNGAYRAQLTSNALIDPYVLFAWQSICEKETKDIKASSALNVGLLKEKLGAIKNLMSDSISDVRQRLQDIMSECGIRFKVVRNFRGAPVQGFIKDITDEESGRHELIMCLTIRRARADIFWFTLFHEIAHVIHGDYKAKFVDFSSESSEAENRADVFARDFLIPPEEYLAFTMEHRSPGWEDIEEFARKVHVQPFIVLGRLQKDEIVDWSEYSDKVVRYKWIEQDD